MPSPDKRQFARIRFSYGATLSFGGGRTPCEVVDLCLKGALLALPADRPAPAAGGPCALELILDGAAATVRMEGTVVHGEDALVGLACATIDLDSITHLRRLLELNLGGSEALQREFHALAAG